MFKPNAFFLALMAIFLYIYGAKSNICLTQNKCINGGSCTQIYASNLAYCACINGYKGM